MENLKEPWEHIPEVLARVKKDYIVKTYKVDEWDGTEDFLEKFCRKSGRLLKVSIILFSAVKYSATKLGGLET